jgi:E3 ubiquitin-protein ligase TRIP12
MLFGNADEDWSIESMLSHHRIYSLLINFSPALSEALKADHGFNVESKAIRDLIEIMGVYDATTRRAFLQFITGSPKLPIGGTIIVENYQEPLLI